MLQSVKLQETQVYVTSEYESDCHGAVDEGFMKTTWPGCGDRHATWIGFSYSKSLNLPHNHGGQCYEIIRDVQE